MIEYLKPLRQVRWAFAAIWHLPKSCRQSHNFLELRPLACTRATLIAQFSGAQTSCLLPARAWQPCSTVSCFTWRFHCRIDGRECHLLQCCTITTTTTTRS